MVRGRIVRAVGIVLAALSAAIVGIAYLSPYILSYLGGSYASLPFYIQFVSPLLGIGSLAFVFLPWFRLMIVKDEPRAVLNDLAHRLRVSRYRVSEEPNRLVVRIDSNSAVKIRAISYPHGTEISYQPDATPSGWSLMLILLLIVPITQPISIVVAFFIFAKVREFAVGRVIPRITGEQVSRLSGQDVDVRAALIDSLSEGHRLAAEAYEGAQSSREDWVLFTMMMGMVLFAGLVVASAVMLPDDIGFPERMYAILLVSTAVPLFLVVASLRVLGQRTGAKIEALRSWSKRLDVALAREVARMTPSEGEPSSIELLADAWRQMPYWINVRRGAGIFRDPGDWFVILACGVLGFGMLAGAIVIALSSFGYAALMALVGVSFSTASLLVYKRWRKRLDDEAIRLDHGWKARFDEMWTEMEKYIQEM